MLLDVLGFPAQNFARRKVLFKSPLKYFARESLSRITENRDVSSETSLGFDTKLSEMLLIYIKKTNGSRIEPLATPTAKMNHTER